MLRRRDLNPGDVFVYASLPPDVVTRDVHAVRTVPDGKQCWYPGAIPSPERPALSYLCKATLDSPVILIPPPKPEAIVAALIAVGELPEAPPRVDYSKIRPAKPFDGHSLRFKFDTTWLDKRDNAAEPERWIQVFRFRRPKAEWGREWQANGYNGKADIYSSLAKAKARGEVFDTLEYAYTKLNPGQSPEDAVSRMNEDY